MPRLFLKDLIKGLVIFCGGIIPVLGASGLPGPPVWLEMAPKQEASGVQAIAGFTGDQQLLLSGVHGSSFSLSGFWGEGEGLSSLTPGLSYTERDAGLFHADYQRPARYTGAALDFVKTGVQFTAGVSQIESAGLSDRISWFTGATMAQLALQVFRVERPDAAAAHALGLQFRLPMGVLSASYAIATKGTAAGAVRWQVPLSRRLHLGLELRDGRSTRFGEGAYQRWIINITDSGGRNPALSAREGGSDTPEIATTALLAAGAVGIALVATSGSDDTDDQLRFSSQHEAARNVLNAINPTSVAQNLEYGGWVYRNADRTFSATEPIKGTVDRVNIGSPTNVPSGYATASYHTHAAYDPRFNSENFSTLDITMNNNWGVDGYLGTPAGYYKYHHYLTGVISTLGTIAN